MNIQPVNSKKLFNQFIRLPYQIYEDDPNWIPPLRIEQKKLFSVSKNPTLSHCEFCNFLVLENHIPVGRVTAFVDHNYNNHWNSRVGFFGSYECTNTPAAANLLLETCRLWLTEKRMTHMRGPINFETQNWGFIVEGFGPQPIMSPYNPPYYNEQMVNFGLSKVKDLEVYAGDGQSYELPERFKRLEKYLIQKYNLKIRSVNMTRLEQEVSTIIQITNSSLSQNWGFAPITNDEAKAIVKDLKNIINPRVILIIEADGRPIAFSIALPDINILLRGLDGQLFPFGFFKIVFGLRKINRYRHWALGVIPEFQRRGIDTLLYLQTYKELKPKATYLEANYVLEDNFAMKDALIKLGLKKIRRYRVYESRL